MKLYILEYFKGEKAKQDHRTWQVAVMKDELTVLTFYYSL